MGHKDFEVTSDWINLPTTTSNPSTLVEGTIWHRSDLNEIHSYLNGVVEVINITPSTVNKKIQSYYFDDFIHTAAFPFINTLDWITFTLGGDSYVEATGFQGGQVEVRAGAVDGRYAEITWNRDIYVIGENVIFNFRGKFDAITNIVAFLGLWEAGNDFCYFEIRLGDTNFQVTTQGSSLERTDTGIAIDTNFHDFKMVTTLIDIKFYIDDVLVATHNTAANLPTARMKSDFYIESKGSATRSFFLDYVEIIADRA